jgi:uncharacterized protein
MGWEVLWALILGFFISAIVQAWVPRQKIEKSLSGEGLKPIALATGLGAASSSCSYAAVAIAKSLFQKGASAVSSLAFQFASTNLVWELGLVLWVLLGWQFTLAEYVGGIVMIAVMALLLRLFVSRQAEAEARTSAQQADTGHMHHMAGSELPLRQRLISSDAWSDVAHNFRGDLQMLGKEIFIGLLISGFVAQFNQHFFHSLFLSSSSGFVQAIWGALIGPVIAMLTFVCSVGNIPLAAVLWSGGISFAGVIAFIFADLVILPIVLIYRKYYGASYAIRITALMLTTMVASALIIEALFHLLGLIPSAPRPARAAIFTGIVVNYKLILNVIAVAVFAVLIALTQRRGVTDPVCGMKVDRRKALRLTHAGHTYYFCSEGCKATFERGPERYSSQGAHASHDAHGHHHPPSTPNSGGSNGYEIKL